MFWLKLPNFCDLQCFLFSIVYQFILFLGINPPFNVKDQKLFMLQMYVLDDLWNLIWILELYWLAYFAPMF
jgi:hypothetical protein